MAANTLDQCVVDTRRVELPRSRIGASTSVVRASLGLGFLGLAACSSSSSSNAATQAATSTTSCSSLTASEYEDGSSCFVSVSTLEGLCRRDPIENRTLGIESVCVVDASGALYVVSVGTDTYLYGSGWTIGSRAAPDSVEASTTPLSPADQTRCNHAQALLGAPGPPISTCSDASPSTDAG